MTTLDGLRARTGEMLAVLRALVETESPSSDVTACAECVRVVADTGARLTGVAPEALESGGRPHLRWRFGDHASVLLLAHLDTVWPLGTLARRPFSVDGDVATGPGAFDMKAGIVQALFALAALADRDGVELLVTSDEEIGSGSSRALIEEASARAGTVLVLEPSERGALKIARKGVSMYELRVEGRASHAGLEPEKGVNALIELAHQVLALEDIAAVDGTTVTPTVARAGTTTNTVPAEAVAQIDVRCSSPNEQARVDAAIRALTPALAGARLTVEGGPNRPPLPRAASAALLARAREIADRLGLAPLEGVEVGGGSDGNFAAATGASVLDGLGPVGAGAHAEDEHVIVPAMPERAALVAALVDELRTAPLGRLDDRRPPGSEDATKRGGRR